MRSLKYLVDTEWVVDYLKGKEEAVKLLDSRSVISWLSCSPEHVAPDGGTPFASAISGLTLILSRRISRIIYL
jgi:hypothetical protein